KVVAPENYTSQMVPGSQAKATSSETRQPNRPSTATDSLGSALVPFSMEVAPNSTIVAPSQVALGSHASNSATDGNEQKRLNSVKSPSVHNTEEIPRLQDSSLSPEAGTLDHCRRVLHSERSLTRYSLKDTMKEADRKAMPVADACIQRLSSLTDLGSTCSESFRWFEAFQTSLINHVKRVCRETTRNPTDTKTLMTGSRL